MARTILDEWDDCIARRGNALTEREVSLARQFFMRGALAACLLLREVQRMVEQSRPLRLVPANPPAPEVA